MVTASCEFTTGGKFSAVWTDDEIIRRFIQDHYEPRRLRTLTGYDSKTYDPVYEDRDTFPAAWALKDRLEEMLAGQMELEFWGKTRRI